MIVLAHHTHAVVRFFNQKSVHRCYCSFKAGPNRGHYHGDQLAIHLCGEAKPLAVDHYCSYRPRAGQEHMHNRLAFSTPDLPYANLDGYERLIALSTGPQADIAVGEVSGSRLRTTREVPPEAWHQEWPEVQLGGNLSYTRSVVLVKGPSDAVVLVDHFKSPKAIQATWCLHGRDTSILRGKWGIPGTLDGKVFSTTEAIAGIRPKDVFLVWKERKDNKGKISYEQLAERRIIESVQENRLTLNAQITVSGTIVCTILDSALRSEPGGVYPLGGLSVHTIEPQGLIASTFPWAHINGALEVTQGLRLSLPKPQTDERIITVLTWNKNLSVKSETDGTITIGPSKVRISADGSITVEGPLGRSAITPKEWNYDRPQGNIGLFIPDAGYPFGPIPDWLLKQRLPKPDWFQAPQALGWKR